MRKHRVTLDDDDEWRFWEASWEAMDIAEANWATAGARPHQAPPSTSRARRSARKTRARARTTRG